MSINPTKVLMEEHRVIERVLASLESAARHAQRGGNVRPGLFLDAADFIKGFADGSHHHKEEGLLFPAMEAAGVPRGAGPIEVLLDEHEEARRLTADMRAAAERLDAGVPGAREEAARHALEYVALLRRHIAKEDRVAFPVADQAIRGAHQARLIDAFARAEREEGDTGARDKYVRLADALEREVRDTVGRPE